MSRRLLLCLALVSASPADEPTDEAEAALWFRRAVRAQGEVEPASVVDARLRFQGQVRDEEGEHAVTREYWYRSKDRSFRLVTRSRTLREEISERGVLGEEEYWDRGSDGAVADLSPANSSDRTAIETIDREREDFEDVLRLVLLKRMDDGRSRFAPGPSGRVRLEKDLPYSPGMILGKDRTQEYRVVDVTREGMGRLRLFLHGGDFTVRKALLFARDDPAREVGTYYFGRFEQRGGLLLPRVVSFHDIEPLDEASRDKGARAYGEIEVTLNAGLKDTDLRP
ncbi:MAG: hypothetical protein ACT4PV_13065 [Planctomycetaceae bacterium]